MGLEPPRVPGTHQVSPLKACEQRLEEVAAHAAMRDMEVETLLRQLTITEHSAIHQQEQNTMLREMLARIVVLQGVEDEAGSKRLVVTRDQSKKIDRQYGIKGDDTLELVVDTDEQGLILRVKERPRLVQTEGSESVLVQIGEHGATATIEKGDEPE